MGKLDPAEQGKMEPRQPAVEGTLPEIGAQASNPVGTASKRMAEPGKKVPRAQLIYWAIKCLLAAIAISLVIVQPRPKLAAMVDYENWAFPPYLDATLIDPNAAMAIFTPPDANMWTNLPSRDPNLTELFGWKEPVDADDIKCMCTIAIWNNGDLRAKGAILKMSDSYGVIIRDKAGSVRRYPHGRMIPIGDISIGDTYDVLAWSNCAAERGCLENIVIDSDTAEIKCFVRIPPSDLAERLDRLIAFPRRCICIVILLAVAIIAWTKRRRLIVRIKSIRHCF